MAAKLNLLSGHPIKGIQASIPKNIDNHNQYGEGLTNVNNTMCVLPFLDLVRSFFGLKVCL